MADNWKGSESELFAEFIEHREVLMIMRKWWRPGYAITLAYEPDSTCKVTIKKSMVNGSTGWAAQGVGDTLDEAAKKAAETAAFRD